MLKFQDEVLGAQRFYLLMGPKAQLDLLLEFLGAKYSEVLDALGDIRCSELYKVPSALKF